MAVEEKNKHHHNYGKKEKIIEKEKKKIKENPASEIKQVDKEEIIKEDIASVNKEEPENDIQCLEKGNLPAIDDLKNVINDDRLKEITTSGDRKENRIYLILACILIPIIIFAAIFIFMKYQSPKYDPNPDSMINVNNSNTFQVYDNSTNEIPKYESLIQEILNSVNYDNKTVSIIGKVENVNSDSFNGYIVDKQGYKLLFKGTNRGFNEAKTYNFTGIINGTDFKYLIIKQSIDDI